MKAERLQKIEEVYHAALEISVGEREFFVAESYGADEDLRREVESLLSFEADSDNLLDAPPEALAAEMFSERGKESNLAGQKFSHYEIKKLIGRGGMGEVYLAEDTKLDRRVAVKFLNEEFSQDADKLKRFIQEAKAASALNHPNILTVYEIGEADGKNYIAAELIDGETLREHLLMSEPMPLTGVLQIGVQVAEALAAAHRAGIIHRDIKPENIMLREDGNKISDPQNFVNIKRSKGFVFSNDGSKVYFTPYSGSPDEINDSEMAEKDLVSGKISKITNFNIERILNYNTSRDGKKFISRGATRPTK